MTERTITPHLPTYAQITAMMKAINGVSNDLLRSMTNTIYKQIGTPQDPIDWSAPDGWIAQRLEGQEAQLAQKIWQQDDHVLNPRYCYWSYLAIKNAVLMELNHCGIWQRTEEGQDFIQKNETVWKKIDQREGILYLLEQLNLFEQAKRADLLPEWMEYLGKNTKWSSENACSSLLYRRLLNMLSRNLIEREGAYYQITKDGKKWLGSIPSEKWRQPQDEIIYKINEYNKRQKKLLKEQLFTLDPYKFEKLVGVLLEAMGYENVVVTKASGDKGVDVKGQIQMGITTVTEVIQVKRMQSNITRPLIDQLRGALPYHNAIRGTFITTSKFSNGCAEAAMFVGAAPITLIDGDQLIELLVQHSVGIQKKSTVELLDVNMQLFDQEELE